MDSNMLRASGVRRSREGDLEIMFSYSNNLNDSYKFIGLY
jgi:hypothetical protein